MRKLILILAAVAAVAVGGTAAVFAQTTPVQTAAAGQPAQPAGINWFGLEYKGGE
jgi:acyl-[acyl carrier protein]--UDP-N-acetylglucosamine O-acyltransferase